MYYNSKKAITEIVAFTLLTLIIVVASLAAYYFSTDQLEKYSYKIDHDQINSKLIKTSFLINSITSFDNSQKTIEYSFKTGELKFNSNQIIYQSQMTSNLNSSFCKNLICADNNNGFEILYINITSPYKFESNFSLIPGNYLLSFKNIKNESKIQVKLLQ